MSNQKLIRMSLCGQPPSTVVGDQNPVWATNNVLGDIEVAELQTRSTNLTKLVSKIRYLAVYEFKKASRK
jgi:hypothetical protein